MIHTILIIILILVGFVSGIFLRITKLLTDLTKAMWKRCKFFMFKKWQNEDDAKPDRQVHIFYF